MTKNCVIYHLQCNFVSIQDLLLHVSPIFEFSTYDSFYQINTSTMTKENCVEREIIHNIVIMYNGGYV